VFVPPVAPSCRSSEAGGLYSRPECQSSRAIKCGTLRSNASCGHSCAVPLAFFLNASTQIYLVILSKSLSCCLIQSCFVSPRAFSRPSSCITSLQPARFQVLHDPIIGLFICPSAPYPRARPHSKKSIHLVHRTSTQVYTLYLQWKPRGNFVPAN
jgi:hypothetical protein